jgi:hypothetical protein
MQCDRCRSGAEAILRVRSDILDMLVCAACAAEARMIGIAVEVLDEKAPQAYPLKQKKGLKNQPLKIDGAGEEGRTPDLMLGKHTL